MVIKGGKVLDDSFKFIDADIEVADNIINKIAFNLSDNEVIDAQDCYVVPGFVDTHMHGANGRSFFDGMEDCYEKVTSYEASMGTTALVPAISAAPAKRLLQCVKYMKECTQKEIDGHSKVYGMHLEGPFFSEEFKGAHSLDNIRNPDLEEFIELNDASSGCIRIMTMAPELAGAEEVIRYAVKQGVCISAGHTSATFEEIKKSVEWGVTQGTHLFNAMSPLKHRAAGAVGGLLHEDTKCELICDFFHVNPEVVKLVYLIKGKEKINMITDSEIGAGLPDGEYQAGGDRTVYVRDGGAYLEDGTICGGSTCLIDGVRNLVSIGIPLEDACMMASKNPSKSAGIYDKVGSITSGKIADILVLDNELNLKHVILRGKLLF